MQYGGGAKSKVHACHSPMPFASEFCFCATGHESLACATFSKFSNPVFNTVPNYIQHLLSQSTFPRVFPPAAFPPLPLPHQVPTPKAPYILLKHMYELEYYDIIGQSMLWTPAVAVVTRTSPFFLFLAANIVVLHAYMHTSLSNISVC